MGDGDRSLARGCAFLAAALLVVPILVVGVVGVKTWLPLREASQDLEALEVTLGPRARYTPAPRGEIPAERIEIFLELRATLVTACGEYGTVQEAFDAIESLDSSRAEVAEIGETARLLGGAALSITPFLAKYFQLRNESLLAVQMGLHEYVYIYATAYHRQLLSEDTRRQIFSDGEALSPEASEMLRGCLARQVEAASSVDPSRVEAVKEELRMMGTDPTRLLWQDGLPAAIRASVTPYRERLDRVFCAATAGLEMDRGALRALRLALE